MGSPLFRTMKMEFGTREVGAGGTIIKVLGIVLVGPWQNWYLHKDKYSLIKHG